MNGFVKIKIHTWLIGSASLTARGLSFLFETFPNNYALEITIASEVVKLECEFSLSILSKTSLVGMDT